MKQLPSRRKNRVFPCMLLLLLPALLFSACKRAPAPESAQGSGTQVFVPLVTAAPAAVPLPTATPGPLDAVGAQYTIAWISDTQHYSRQNNGVFECMTQFLSDNAARMNLRYIVHTGDLVHNRDQAAQWAVADAAMRTVDGIPNGVLAGNHDVGTKPEDCDYTYFSQYFGAARYEGRPWYGGTYLDNRGHYDLIDAGNTQYLFVYLGYQLTPEGLAWARAVFEQYPDRVGALCLHDYFYHDCTLTEQGQLAYDALVKPVENLYMVLCGHRYNSACIPASFDDDGDGAPDRTVLQMIANYQAVGDADAETRTGGEGYLRLLQVDEDAGLIRYASYSPYLDDFTYFDDPAHQGENYAFSAAGEAGTLAIPWEY